MIRPSSDRRGPSVPPATSHTDHVALALEESTMSMSKHRQADRDHLASVTAASAAETRTDQTRKVIDRARRDPGMAELLGAIDAVHRSLRADANYLAEALVAEQQLVADQQRRMNKLEEVEASARRDVMAATNRSERLDQRVGELEQALIQTRQQGEAEVMAVIDERDRAIERLQVRNRGLEGENARLADELAELRQRIRPVDVAKEPHADPAVALVVDGDQLVRHGWSDLPLAAGRDRAITALGRLGEAREAPVEIVFGSSEGLDETVLAAAPVRVRVMSEAVDPVVALTRLRDTYDGAVRVALITDRPEIIERVSMVRLLDLLGLPLASGREDTVRSIATNR